MKYQHGFEPLVPGFKYVRFGDVKAVERAVDNRTAATLVEPILGSYRGRDTLVVFWQPNCPHCQRAGRVHCDEGHPRSQSDEGPRG